LSRKFKLKGIIKRETLVYTHAYKYMLSCFKWKTC